MQDLSEENIRKNCPHCNAGHVALKFVLKETENFRVVCDYNPLTEGHILIIPKAHISCVGEMDDDHFFEFKELYNHFSEFLKKEYRSIATFEHGKVGQTVFHCHVHLLPFEGNHFQIIPEGESKLSIIGKIDKLREEYRSKGKYLFLSINDKMWLVDTGLGVPRFFRDRFSKALGNPKRGNWKNIQENAEMRKELEKEINSLMEKYKKYE